MRLLRALPRAALVGAVSLLLAEASMVLAPAGWATFALAGVATIGLARAPALGWLPAGLLVALALPFGRGADLDPLTVAGVPLHPQDLAIGVAVVGALATLARDPIATWRARLAGGGGVLVVAAAVFATVGVASLTVGVANGHAARDILRDARWWFLYLAAPLALVAGVTRRALLRALALGAGAFSVTILVTLCLPAVGNGLKAAAIATDLGELRMQYGNSVFLVPATALLAQRFVALPRVSVLATLAVLTGAQVTSLTRVSLMVTGVVVLVIIIAHVGRGRRAAGGAARAGIGASVLLAAVVGISTVAGVALMDFTTFAEAGPGSTLTHPLDRLLFQDSASDVAAIVGSAESGGRLRTYLDAYDLFRPVPVLGAGMGQLIPVAFASHPGRVFEEGLQPGVDNAYLTAGVKAGAVGIVALTALLLVPLLVRARRRPVHTDALSGWFLPAWLGILVLTMTQSFAVSGYAPFGVALLLALPSLDGPERDIMSR